MPTQSLLKAFGQVSTVLEEVRQNPVGPEQIKRIVKVSEYFLSAFKLSPDVFVAQPLLYKSRSGFLNNLTFNTLVYCALICNRARINDLCCQQLLSCILTLYCERQEDLQGFYQQNQRPSHHRKSVRLLQILNRANLQTWMDGYQVYKYLFSKFENNRSWPKDLTKNQQVILLAHQLATQVTPSEVKKPVHFSSAIRKLTQTCPESYLNSLNGLLQYPTLICPGTLVKLDQQQPAVVLSVSEDKVLVIIINSKGDEKAQLKRVFNDNIQRVSATQTVTGFSQIQRWWDINWQIEKSDCINPIEDNFPLDKPPTLLLEVQKHLNSGSVDIDKLALQISSEPAFADYLKQTATISNRNKLPVQQVKHGLMMHGYVKANSMLIQQALLLRLNQSHFPLQQNFTQFIRLACQIAANLSAQNKHVSPEEASTLLCFACSGLFTQPALKTRTQWTRRQERQQDISYLFDFRNPETLRNHSLKLCQAWQQPTLYSDAIMANSQDSDELSKNPILNTLTVTLGLSVLLARRLYFSEHQLNDVSQRFYTNSLRFLKLNEQKVSELLANSLQQSHSYCALP
ncbi:hypothetical protein [Aliiglaciecola sp. NS0011-25]|uniref:hypothetical protein n=1 Tax=Aliiglaciecola sp. NS0011-25 TaxID=3127654 RepID=UPI00333EF5FD